MHGVCPTDVTINNREDIATDVTFNRDLSKCKAFFAHRQTTSPLALITGMVRATTSYSHFRKWNISLQIYPQKNIILVFRYRIQRLKKHLKAPCVTEIQQCFYAVFQQVALSHVLTLCCLSAIRASLCPRWSAAPRLATTGLTTTRSTWPEESALRNTSSCPCPTSKFE